jgi:hypothetical protein
VRWVPCLKCRVKKQMVKRKARLRVKEIYEVKAKVMKGKVGPCRVLRPDDWIGCEVVGFWWGWGGGMCFGFEDRSSRGCHEGREGQLCGDIQGGI